MYCKNKINEMHLCICVNSDVSTKTLFGDFVVKHSEL